MPTATVAFGTGHTRCGRPEQPLPAAHKMRSGPLRGSSTCRPVPLVGGPRAHRPRARRHSSLHARRVHAEGPATAHLLPHARRHGEHFGRDGQRARSLRFGRRACAPTAWRPHSCRCGSAAAGSATTSLITPPPWPSTHPQAIHSGSSPPPDRCWRRCARAGTTTGPESCSPASRRPGRLPNYGPGRRPADCAWRPLSTRWPLATVGNRSTGVPTGLRGRRRWDMRRERLSPRGHDQLGRPAHRPVR